TMIQETMIQETTVQEAMIRETMIQEAMIQETMVQIFQKQQGILYQLLGVKNRYSYRYLVGLPF
ncbi:hypothetical protein ABWL48_11915, partial [Streptococcus suis]